MREKLIEIKLREKVAKLGGIALKIYCLSFTGLPDRMLLMPGARVWFAETKSTGQKLRPRQQVVKTLLEKLGFTVFVIDTDESLENCLTTIAA